MHLQDSPLDLIEACPDFIQLLQQIIQVIALVKARNIAVDVRDQGCKAFQLLSDGSFRISILHLYS